MRIESPTTGEHRIRTGIFLLMCLVFAGYFGYDGLWGYPGKNLDWAKQHIQNVPPDQREKIQTNPKVTMAQVGQVKKEMAVEQVKALLGEPAIIASRSNEPGWGEDYWYVGPAACAAIRILDSKVKDLSLQENLVKSESDIRLQKIIAAVLGALLLVVAIHFLRVVRMRTILDEAGLTVKGRQVSWDQILELDTQEYGTKGWLDVTCRANGDTDSVRLDSYHIQRFDEIVNAICERKGFASPIKHQPTEPPDEA